MHQHLHIRQIHQQLVRWKSEVGKRVIPHNSVVEPIQMNCYCVALLHMPVVLGY